MSKTEFEDCIKIELQKKNIYMTAYNVKRSVRLEVRRASLLKDDTFFIQVYTQSEYFQCCKWRKT